MGVTSSSSGSSTAPHLSAARRGGDHDLAGSGASNVGFADFTDPRFPPLGTVDYFRDDLISARSDVGLELELERRLTDSIGIGVGLGYARLVSETTFSGEGTHAPYVGEPRTLAPDRSRSGPVTGGGTGSTHLMMLTASARLHLLRSDSIDVYLGPLVGVAASEARFAHGNMFLLIQLGLGYRF